MPPAPSVDVVCLGESMVTFVPSRPGRLAEVPAFARGIGGAESNVACGLAGAGHGVRWISRVGTDGFGDHLLTEIAAAGVDVSGVQRDPRRPTGIYFRTAGERAVESEPSAEDDGEQPLAEVLYYRAGSAAAAMSPALMPHEQTWSGRILHVTGITPALSPECLALMRELTTRAPGRPLVSFDLNYRVSLWEDPERAPDEGPSVLLDLARGCDLVFVGEDEAEAAWGIRGGAAAIREALPEPDVLVVKQGSAGATAYARGADGADTVTFVPALRVDVVAPVGAGDAFAAGFLSGTLRGLPVAQRLRHGHLMAAAVLTVPGDLCTPPSRAYADRLVTLGDAEWGTLRFGPGWADPARSGSDTAVVEVTDP
ncbi:2-keto-3-deoxygluconate kinase [Streptomyces himastatinicus ATCC 53653]|uniref:2-keto-3-deoxygluconate kinase n=1 Tax=Streptomyces himastatinicus ATCC 53653 TaxID=457427 RepID=D9WK09_9ACTN|nr:sugar kinase [Streptomyces himastatinicus]EFL23572.1 2-keto-3-deoxygluconate kinase [Streptomyces himastatinicus ATCC 53653]